MGRFQKHIFVCINERPTDHPKGCCFHKGSPGVRDKFKEVLKAQGISSVVRANNSGCLDACEHGISAVVYPEGIWYGGITVNDVDEIVREHIIGGTIVKRLLIKDKKYECSSLVEPLKV